MSTEISKLPPHVQERLLRLQQRQQTLQAVLTQKQQLELELTEVEQALGELEKMTDDAVIYKSVGSLLVKSERPKVTSELNERKDLLNMRINVLGKQEERLRSQIKELQTKLQQDLNLSHLKGEKPLEEIGIPTLTPEQVEELCEIAEEAARKYVLSQIPIHRVSDLNLTIDIQGLKPLTANVDLEITLSPLMKDYPVEKLAEEAEEKVFTALENRLRKLACPSKK